MKSKAYVLAATVLLCPLSSRFGRATVESLLDASFAPPVQRGISALAVQSDGLFRFKSSLTNSWLQFSQTNYVAGESEGSATVTVERIGDANGPVSVDYFTTGLAAVSSNHQEQTGVLTFAYGETAKVITVSFLDNPSVEADRTIGLTLTNPSTRVFLRPERTAVLRILDDERPGSVDLSFSASGTTVGGEEISNSNYWFPLTVQRDSRIWVSGFHNEDLLFGGVLKLDGSLDLPLSADLAPGRPRAIGVQSDGGTVVWSRHLPFLDSEAVWKVKPDGSFDAVFQSFPQGNWGILHGGAVQPDDRILLFSGEDNDRNLVIRLTPLGKRDDTFNELEVDFQIRSIAFREDGKILFGGSRWSKSVSRPVVTRFLPDGVLDTQFNPPISGESDHGNSTRPVQEVKSILVQSDGKLILAGCFSIQNDPSRSNLARLNSDGSLDNNFARAAVPTNEFSTVAVLQEDGKIVLASTVYSPDSSYQSTVTRLNPDGSADRGFDTVNVNGWVQQLALQLDGRLLMAGFLISEIDGVKRQGLARLNLRPSFRFGPVAVTRNGELSLNLTVEHGMEYVLQASNDFVNWFPLVTNTATSFSLQFNDDTTAPSPHRFYRATRNPSAP